MTIDFESDAQAITVQDNSLAAISELGRQAILIEKDIEDLEATLAEKRYMPISLPSRESVMYALETSTVAPLTPVAAGISIAAMLRPSPESARRSCD